jgi:hypothetical protein
MLARFAARTGITKLIENTKTTSIRTEDRTILSVFTFYHHAR